MANFYGDSDIQPMLDTFGVPVVVGAVHAKGIFNEPTAEILANNFPHISTANGTVLVKTGTFALATGAAITVAGVAYKIADFRQEQDGAVTRVVLVSSL